MYEVFNRFSINSKWGIARGREPYLENYKIPLLPIASFCSANVKSQNNSSSKGNPFNTLCRLSSTLSIVLFKKILQIFTKEKMKSFQILWIPIPLPQCLHHRIVMVMNRLLGI